MIKIIQQKNVTERAVAPSHLKRIGTRYFKLVVTGVSSVNYHGVRWICKCDCGGEILVHNSNLVSGKAKSCGCSKNKSPIIGKKFGKLTVIDRATSGCNRNTRWNCACDCGNTLPIYNSNLVSGSTTSCGCAIAKKK